MDAHKVSTNVTHDASPSSASERACADHNTQATDTPATLTVRIKRQRHADSAPYYQSFTYTGTRDITVAALLDVINYTDDLYDTEGQPAPRILWECSCLQNMCGACAMVINGIPALACQVFLRDLPPDKITLEPLSKFPVVHDLVVDRRIIEENLNLTRMYPGASKAPDSREYEHLYTIAKCLKCGLCLEVCPNYHRGERFHGALLANEACLSRGLTKERQKDIKRAYAKHFAAGCSKARSCASICPMNLPTLSSMLKMNR
ncbi:MAG: 2Fe-2S iron-sulfur cluster-binding protein [Lachnospiraceae bacterium]|nr:2Fe-2S iron-sulfur cluster-binding protein [Lachnospiraceae bacterium]